MVERLVHTEEVIGSMPVSPTREGPGQSISGQGLRSFRAEGGPPEVQGVGVKMAVSAFDSDLWKGSMYDVLGLQIAMGSVDVAMMQAMSRPSIGAVTTLVCELPVA